MKTIRKKRKKETKPRNLQVLNKPCKECGIDFPYYLKNRLFCNSTCQTRSWKRRNPDSDYVKSQIKPKPVVQCRRPECERLFIRNRSDKVYCSVECYYS